MSRFAWLVAVCGLALTAAPAFAADVKPAAKKKADPTERILDALSQEFALKEGVNVNETPLFELLQYVGKLYVIDTLIAGTILIPVLYRWRTRPWMCLVAGVLSEAAFRW